jgi:Fe-S cluster biogenesis protein NfuA
MAQVPLEISLELTPNPNTLKYALNRRILLSGTRNFPTAEAAKADSPLAERLFAIEGIGGVMLGPTFVTVSLTRTDHLRDLNRQVMAALRTHLESGAEICRATDALQPQDEDATSRRIREIIDGEIRPAVAMDGGDITFEGFRDGVVYVYLMGACSGCPSASMTLKHGIEHRLKQAVPEVKSVEQV